MVLRSHDQASIVLNDAREGLTEPHPMVVNEAFDDSSLHLSFYHSLLNYDYSLSQRENAHLLQLMMLQLYPLKDQQHYERVSSFRLIAHCFSKHCCSLDSVTKPSASSRSASQLSLLLSCHRRFS